MGAGSTFPRQPIMDFPVVGLFPGAFPVLFPGTFPEVFFPDSQ